MPRLILPEWAPQAPNVRASAQCQTTKITFVNYRFRYYNPESDGLGNNPKACDIVLPDRKLQPESMGVTPNLPDHYPRNTLGKVHPGPKSTEVGAAGAKIRKTSARDRQYRAKQPGTRC